MFPDAVKRTLDEARNFHRQIVSNRRDFLEAEINRIQQAMIERDNQIKELTDHRAKVMQVLHLDPWGVVRGDEQTSRAAC